MLADGILMPPAPGSTRRFLVMLEITPVMAARTAMLGTVVAGLRVTRKGIAEALRAS